MQNNSCACESPYAKSVKNLTHEGQATAHTVFFRGIKNIWSDGEVTSWVRCLEYCGFALNWTGTKNMFLSAKGC